MSVDWPLFGKELDALENNVWLPDEDEEATKPIVRALETVTTIIRRSTPAACPDCGGVIDADGYCETCGSKAPKKRDHIELHPSELVAGVCDRGVVHSRNEDAISLFCDDTRAVLVVCDGVSTSTNSDVAAAAAAEKACQFLATAPAIAESLTHSVELANQAVIAASDPTATDAAAATICAALLVGNQLHYASLGDSRIYWIGESEARQLTSDDSLAAELIATGVPRKQAETSPGAHAITGWLGPDCENPIVEVGLEVLSPGVVLVCSDGLWNYASEPNELGELVRTLTAESKTGLELSRSLVQWAIDRGGHDNVAVAVARLLPENVG